MESDAENMTLAPTLCKGRYAFMACRVGQPLNTAWCVTTKPQASETQAVEDLSTEGYQFPLDACLVLQSSLGRNPEGGGMA